MQISAANLLLAAQQAARQTRQPPDGPAFAAALQKTSGRELFAPLEFVESVSEPAAPAPRTAAAPEAPSPPGTRLDIRI